MEDFIERLKNKEKPLREHFHGECTKCGKRVIAKYALGHYYYLCECGNLDTIEN